MYDILRFGINLIAFFFFFSLSFSYLIITSLERKNKRIMKLRERRGNVKHKKIHDLLSFSLSLSEIAVNFPPRSTNQPV